MKFDLFKHRIYQGLVISWLAGLFWATPLWAVPFAERIPFAQPDGTRIEIWGEGDEFYAVFETLDGYTVLFDQNRQAYCFAQLSANGAELVSTGVQVHQGTGADLGLAKHLRITREARRQKAKARRDSWEQAMAIPQRWQALKAGQQQGLAAGQGDASYAPPWFTTVGTKVGLTLLIDFDDDPATIPQANIVNFCNGDNYTGYGNNGSVKNYYYDVSNGRLTYSNVVTVYIRIPNSVHPKSYYNDTSRDAGLQGRLLIADAVAIMKTLTNFTTEILPAFEALTTDGNNNLVAANIFYAGGNGGVWSYGLWPHSWSLAAPLEISPGGKRISRYQITNIGGSLALGTFCHENGHMLCGFPDIYDYDYDSAGGAGRFCLMNSGGSGGNPAQPCAYLKRAAGWATTVELTSASRLTATVSATGSNFNRFYRYAKPGSSTEYFLLENRQRTGRDSGIPASGVAIWHIDEYGDKDNQNMTNNTTHQNYEVTLVQADNQWHFQRDMNNGDAYDLWYAGNSSAQYQNLFNDYSFPNARWWSGSNSWLNLRYFSASGNTMTFMVGEGDSYLGYEAESGTLTAPMAIEEDALASQGQYIVSSEPGQGSATYAFNIPETNQYVIWCRVLVTNASQNSFVVSMDGAEDIFDVAPTSLTNAWQWVRVNGQNGTGVPLTLNPRPFNLRSGSHTLVFRAHEPGAKLDRFIITSDTYFVPDDIFPTIQSHPRSLTLVAGGTAAFSVQAIGLPALGYRWLSNGVFIAEATNMDYVISNVQTNHAADYAAVVTNLFGAVTSQVAVLRVVPMPPAWVAFNDHFAGPATHTNTTAWNVFGTSSDAPGSSGPLKDIVSGADLPVTLTISHVNATGGTTSGQPAPGTPAYNTFNRFVDFGSGTVNHAIMVASGASVAHVFSGLNPARRYSLRATAMRGGSPGGGTAPDYYSNRWTRVELSGAASFANAHTPGVLTPEQVPGALGFGQVAFNTGVNTNGEMVGWDNIIPSASGTFTVYTTRYTNTVPNGETGSPQGYSYALAAVRLEEIGSSVVPYFILQPRSLSVTEGWMVTFTALAAGNPAGYQWCKDGLPVSNATNANLTLPSTTTNDAGAYTLICTNYFGAVTSEVAVLTINPGPRVGWIAFNDHAAGAGTHANATRWNAFHTTGGAPGSTGPLKNIANGTNLPVSLQIVNSGATAGGTQGAAASNSPAYNTFNGFVDFQGSPNPSIELGSTAVVTYQFSGLKTNREYNFAGTAIRGTNTYTNRWTLFEIAGANSYVSAHTANAYTNGLSASQVAICTGYNSSPTNGDMAVWEHIRPGNNGRFNISCRRYSGAIPGGTANGSSGYAMTGFRLEEAALDPVTIMTQPESLTALVGDTVSFSVTASGTPPLSYRWYRAETNLPGATGRSLLLTNVQLWQAGDYYVVVANPANTITSSIATLSIIDPPTILTLPISQTVVAGEPVTLSVVATGSPPLTYQWRRNGVDLNETERVTGVTNSTLVISSTVRNDAGDYTVLVSNPGDSVLSSPAAQVSVAPIRFNVPLLTTNGQMQLSWRGEPDLAFAIQVSTNLLEWQTLTILTNTVGEMIYIDESATNCAQRFYRATSP